MNSRSANINRSKVHEDMVQLLAVQKLEPVGRNLFPTIRELLCFAALLGFSEGRRTPLDAKAGLEDVSYQQFERGDAEDLIYLIALAETKDPDILKDGNEKLCAEIFEEYANGGLYIIQDALRKGGGEYPDRDIMELFQELKYLDVDEESVDLNGVTF